MRKIISIFVSDLSLLRRNLIGWLVIMGLIVVPPLYAWFNISASWDPYEKTNELQIAIANTDEGYQGDLLPVSLNMGDRLISEVRTTQAKYDWIVTDKEDAIEGVKSGKYYAAVVIPESFSQDMMSLFSNNIRHSDLIYYSNEKENAIASKVTQKGAASIQADITNQFTESILEVALNTIKQMASGDNKALAKNVLTNLSIELGEAENVMQMTGKSLEALMDSTDAAREMLKSAEKFAEAAGETGQSAEETATLAKKQLKQAQKEIDEEVSGLSDVLDVLEGLEASEDVKRLISETRDVEKSIKNVNSSISQTMKTLDSSSANISKNLDKVMDNMADISDDAATSLVRIKKNLKSTVAVINRTSTSMGALHQKIDKALKTDDMQALEDFLSADTVEMSSFMAAPVLLNTTKVYPVEHFGTAMTPFYTALALWVGGLIMIALMQVTLSNRRKESLGITKDYQIYLGRLMIFLSIGILQSLLVCFGDLFYLDVQCSHIGLFILACLYSSIVFVIMTYTLVASFGDVGKAICIILLVMQVAGSGGTFPIEMTPKAFQMVYPALPFTHSLAAMREALLGTYGGTYWVELGHLSFYLVGALILGLVLRKPIIKLNAMFMHKLEDTKLM